MNFIFLIIAVLLTAFASAYYKIAEAEKKEELRRLKADFSFLSSKSFMALGVFIFLSPVYTWVEWDIKIVTIILGLSLLRFIPWVVVNIAKGNFSDATHQKSSNFTMLENFSGPLGALIIYGIINSINGNVSIFWYIISPFMGIFLLWALREKSEKKISREMLSIIALQAILVAAETAILLYSRTLDLEINPAIAIDKGYITFIVIVGFSSLMSGMFLFKNIISDYRDGVLKEGVKIGLIASLHDILYFASFSAFGPIFLIARRGLIIPVQNLLLGLRGDKTLKELLIAPLRIPLLDLKGGKDFIISFTDLVFNRLVKVIINLSSS